MLSSLARVNEKIKIGKLLRGAAKEAEAMHWKLFHRRTERKVMAAFKRNTVRQATVFDHSNN